MKQVRISKTKTKYKKWDKMENKGECTVYMMSRKSNDDWNPSIFSPIFFNSIECVICIYEILRWVRKGEENFNYAYVCGYLNLEMNVCMYVCMYVDCRYGYICVCVYIYSSVSNTLNFHSLYFKRWFGEVDDSLFSPPYVLNVQTKNSDLSSIYLSLLCV